MDLALPSWVGRLLLSLLLGSMLGFERYFVRKPAGIRTMSLVSLGATVVMVLADEWRHENPLYDPTRVVQGLITGVGFLGAGVILHRRGTVKGLTTAATVWLSATVGIACGSGEFALAIWATAIGLFVLQVYGRMEEWMKQRGLRAQKSNRIVRRPDLDPGDRPRSDRAGRDRDDDDDRDDPQQRAPGAVT